VEHVAGAERADGVDLVAGRLDDLVAGVGAAPLGAARDDDELRARVERGLRRAEALAQLARRRRVERDAGEVEAVDRVASVDAEP
jgi:hypothetical protein